jgi:hypothetical protein
MKQDSYATVDSGRDLTRHHTPGPPKLWNYATLLEQECGDDCRATIPQ